MIVLIVEILKVRNVHFTVDASLSFDVVVSTFMPSSSASVLTTGRAGPPSLLLIGVSVLTSSNFLFLGVRGGRVAFLPGVDLRVGLAPSEFRLLDFSSTGFPTLPM